MSKQTRGKVYGWMLLMSVGLTACVLYGQQGDQTAEMSARDMFRNASKLFGKKQASGTSSRAKKTTIASTKKSTPAPKQETQSETVVAENQDRRPATVPDEGEAQVIQVGLEPEAYPLGLRYSFLKQQGNATVEVDTETAFRSGERIRLTIESNDSAYL